jgi:hypothetical protein
VEAVVIPADAPRFARALAASLTLAGVAIVAYWVVWFFIDRSWLASLDTDAYVTFENAFPAADSWLAIACAASVWAIRRRRPSAVFWLSAGGSAAIYLGLMDVLFDVENRVYLVGDTGAVITEATVNVMALGLGGWAMWFGWHHRTWFLART